VLLFLLLSNLKKNQKQKLKEEPAPAKVEAAKTESYASQSPSPAKKILDEKGINASQVSGTGRDGRITKDDAEQLLFLQWEVLLRVETELRPLQNFQF
jgi:pyruvate/2-oxoglutarate dehydrogenase complex dihydrolipoamide acyltransferase (E2) component